MNRAALSRTLIAFVAATSLASCDNLFRGATRGPDPKGPIQVKFTCTGTPTISLVDKTGIPAWNITQKKGTDISWEVDQSVSIDAITWKTSPVPIDVDPGEHGQGGGKKYKGKIKGNASETNNYSMTLTCTQGTTSTQIVIDPVMIVH
jgi:hypothetical protein